MPDEIKQLELKQEDIERIIEEKIEARKDIDKEVVTVEDVREIIREEFPILLGKSTFKIEGSIQLLDGRHIILGSTNGNKIGTSATQKLAFWGGTPQTRPTNGANLTNNVDSGGTDDTIANYTDLSVYANDAATIRNDIFQLAKKLKVVNDALRSIGLMS